MSKFTIFANMKTTAFFFGRLAMAGALILAIASCKQDPKPDYYGTLVPNFAYPMWDESVWISVPDAPVVTGEVKDKMNNRAADGASWFVSSFKNEKEIASAKWMTSGLGVYEIYINGKRIGKQVLKPGFTHHTKTRYAFIYDVTDVIDKAEGAENVLAAEVTPGWWADKIVTPGGHDGMLGKKCAFRGTLHILWKDGTQEFYHTDTHNWKAGIAGPVTHAAIFDGEEYDARILPGYETPEKLGKPEINTEFDGAIMTTYGAEVYHREDLSLKPVEAYVWEGVEGESEDEYGKVVIKQSFTPGTPVTVRPGQTLVVDFGQNAAAVPDFVFSAPEGTVLTCLPGEIVNDGNGSKKRGMDGPEGSVHRLNLRIPDDGMRVVYTFGPADGFVSYRPRFTFFGYRYLSITASDEVRIKSLLSVPVSSISKKLETGVITTGDESVNRLIENAVWGQRSNYLSVPTDCPQRNERLGWTADTQVFTEAGTFFANTDRFFHKWMRDMRDSQSPVGGFPGVAPTAQYGDEMMRLGWADAGIIVPWIVWKQFGDPSIVEENWDAMDLFMNHIYDTKYDHATLSEENRNYQWADWLSYEALESNGGGAFTPRDANGKRSPLPDAITYWNYLSASYWAMDAAMMRDMAAATGRNAQRYQIMLDDAIVYLRHHFLNYDGSFKCEVFNTMQTPALFALKNGLVEGEAKDNLIARLSQNFDDHGNCLQTGFLGTSILMGVLTENGMADMAYELLFQRKNPSWLYSVDNGATTIWERWNSYTIESGMAPKGMNSFNHYAYGSVCAWIWETVAGIAADVAEPGFKHIIMKPVPDKRLGYVNAEYKSAAGLIKSSWKYQGDKWIWNFTVPEGATASVTLPGESESKDYRSGSYKVVKKLVE